MQKNLFHLSLIKVVEWFMLVMPIAVLFYNANGLNQTQIFILQGFYSVTVVVMEIPSGYFADVIGRKKSLVAGSILGFFGYLIYSSSGNFWGFLFAEIMLGIGQSLMSGADSALLYDSLQSANRKSEYLKIEGRITSIGNFAEALAGISGGFLALYSLRLPYILQAGVAFIAIPAALSLTEPQLIKKIEKPSLKNIIDITQYALVSNRHLRFAILFSSVIGCTTLTMAWFVQPYFIFIGVPVFAFGILWTILNASVGVTALLAHHFERLMNLKQLFLVIIISLSVSYIFLAQTHSYLGIGLILIFYLIRGWATPVLKNEINRQTPSEYRATILSVRNFIIRFGFALIGPILGYFTDSFSLKSALSLAGIVFLITGLYLLFSFIRPLNKTSKEINYFT